MQLGLGKIFLPHGLVALMRQIFVSAMILVVVLSITRGITHSYLVPCGVFLSIVYVAWDQYQFQKAKESNFSGQDSISMDFRIFILYTTQFFGGHFPNFNLRSADLRNFDLRDANLMSAILYEANLTGANLSTANLIGANLSKADLTGANLREADLSNADLIDAILYEADFVGADLSGADLSGANVIQAHFGYNTGIDALMRSDLIRRGAIFEDVSGTDVFSLHSAG